MSAAAATNIPTRSNVHHHVQGFLLFLNFPHFRNSQQTWCLPWVPVCLHILSTLCSLRWQKRRTLCPSTAESQIKWSAPVSRKIDSHRNTGPSRWISQKFICAWLFPGTGEFQCRNAEGFLASNHSFPSCRLSYLNHTLNSFYSLEMAPKF